MSLTIVNASRWPSFTESNTTLFAAHECPKTIDPTNCNTPHAFAWLLFDKQAETITAARDYLGLEPFFYCYRNQTFTFGSTLPDVLNQLPSQPELNVDRLLTECFHDGKYLMAPYSNETHYQGVFRLEPGSTLCIKQGKLHQEKYWQFDKGGPTLRYKNDQEYVEHFGELLQDIILTQIKGHQNLAMEYSGGLDSTSILATCHRNHIHMPLFCHVGGEDCEQTGDFSYAECVIQRFQLTDVHRIDAKHFDPKEQFQKLSNIYAGAPPYIFSVMSNNVYEAIAQQGRQHILSGFGGDQCVSSHGEARGFYPELLRDKQYKTAWTEYATTHPNANRIRAFTQLLRYANPHLHNAFTQLEDAKRFIASHWPKKDTPSFRKGLPMHRSLRELHLNYLEGSLSHEVRMRVEYSAILGKTLGFSHSYPLLHPKLIDFALRLPPEQKRRNGMGRYLIRQYLAQFVPEANYQQDKKKGAYIMPAVINKCRQYEASKQLDDALPQLPFYQKIKQTKHPHHRLRHKICAAMIVAYLG